MNVHLLAAVLALISPFLPQKTATLPERVAAAGGKPVTRGLLTDLPVYTLGELESQADLIVVGRLTLSRTWLSDDKYYIMSDYDLVADQVVVDRTSPETSRTVGQLPPRTVTLLGGDLLIDGVPASLENVNLRRLKIGSTMLMFLIKSGRPNNFGPVGGGAVLFQADSAGKLHSVLAEGRSVDGVDDLPIGDVASNIATRGATRK